MVTALSIFGLTNKASLGIGKHGKDTAKGMVGVHQTGGARLSPSNIEL